MRTGAVMKRQEQIEAIRGAESRELERFDVGFDLPKHLTSRFRYTEAATGSLSYAKSGSER